MTKGNGKEMAPEILVLEDEPLVGLMVARLLLRWGWAPVIAHSLAEGRQHLTRPLQAALLDVQVGEEDGVTFFLELPAPLQARTVFVSGDAHSVQRAAQTGQPVLQKPYSLHDLRDVLSPLQSP